MYYFVIFLSFAFFRQYTPFFEKRKQNAREILESVSLAKGRGLWYHNRDIEKKNRRRGFVYGKIIFQIRRDGQLQISAGAHHKIQL